MGKRSVKLPLLFAAPVLLVLVGVGLCLSLPDPPSPPPTPEPPPLENTSNVPPSNAGEDPLVAEIDSQPNSSPKEAPGSAAIAEAMLDEAWDAMTDIRSRLELRYKQAEYKLDRSLTLEAVMRRLSRLDGKYFEANDYGLSFPLNAGEVARIECRTANGRELSDGPLEMLVDLRTGETSREGTIFARNAGGYVLFGEREYRALTELLREAVLSHYNLQSNSPENLAAFSNILPEETPHPFTEGDFKFEAVGEMQYRLLCASARGEALAQPITIAVDYIANSITVSDISSEEWMRVPDDREQLERRIDGLLGNIAIVAASHLENGTKPEDLRIYLLGGSRWYYRWAEISPFDVKLEVSDSKPYTITLTVATSYGRALPFEAVRFVSKPSEGQD